MSFSQTHLANSTNYMVVGWWLKYKSAHTYMYMVIWRITYMFEESILLHISWFPPFHKIYIWLLTCWYHQHSWSMVDWKWTIGTRITWINKGDVQSIHTLYVSVRKYCCYFFLVSLWAFCRELSLHSYIGNRMLCDRFSYLLDIKKSPYHGSSILIPTRTLWQV